MAEKRNTRRWTSDEINQQVSEVVEMMGKAMSPYKIRKHLWDKWEMPEATAHKRIASARQVLVQDHLSVSRADKAADLVNLMGEVIEMSLANNRGNDAIGAARLIAEITKLNRD